MKPPALIAAGAALLALGTLMPLIRAQSSQAPARQESPRTIKATGRGIPQALDVIEQRYGVAIDYSDPQYAGPDVQRFPAPPGPSRNPMLIPKIRTLEFQYFEESGTPEGVPYIRCDPATLGCAPVTARPVGGITNLLLGLVDEFADEGGPVFGVRKLQGLTGPQWEVYPEQARSKSGAWAPQTDFLGATIYIPTEERSAGQMLQLIAQQLTVRWGRKFEAFAPQIYPMRTKAQFGAEDITARQALLEVLGGFKPPFVWRMYYGPQDGSYVINIASLPYREPPRPEPPAALLPPAPLPTTGWLQRAETPQGVFQIQKALAKLGYLKAAPATRWNTSSVAAFRRFQAANSIPTTGALDVQTMIKLEPHMPLVRIRLTQAQIRQEEYLLRLNYWLGTIPDGVTALQEALAKTGFYKGAPTGEWDAKTLDAMKAFKKANPVQPGENPGAAMEKLLPYLPNPKPQ